MQTASDEQVFARAASEHRVIVSADTDFAFLLALRDVSEPSVILFRGTSARSPKKQVALLLDNLGAIEDALGKGAVVVFDERRIRVRMLPDWKIALTGAVGVRGLGMERGARACGHARRHHLSAQYRGREDRAHARYQEEARATGRGAGRGQPGTDGKYLQAKVEKWAKVVKLSGAKLYLRRQWQRTTRDAPRRCLGALLHHPRVPPLRGRDDAGVSVRRYSGIS